MIPTFHTWALNGVKNQLRASATLILQTKSPVTFIHEDDLQMIRKRKILHLKRLESQSLQLWASYFTV
jgi:hypothetical protein